MSIRADDEVLIVISASKMRRWTAILVFVALSFVMLWIAFIGTGSLPGRLFFLGLGLVTLWIADVLRRSTTQAIELTRWELRTSEGRVLTTVENVRQVEKGAFAFKPSNGFLVRLKSPSGRGWAPGIWWQGGTFLGVGGVVSAGQAKAMAEILAAINAGLWQDPPGS